jgi:hypothetical protein
MYTRGRGGQFAEPVPENVLRDVVMTREMPLTYRCMVELFSRVYVREHASADPERRRVRAKGSEAP